jgi:serpin B
MQQAGRFRYVEDDRMQALELPYKGNDYSLVLLLPRKDDGLGALEKELKTDWLRERLGRMRERQVGVVLPRFALKADYALRKPLSELGMPTAFRFSADLSRMAGEPGDLHLSVVVHKACVEVGVVGTEASAATGAVTHSRGVELGPVVRADHPFVFLIRDLRSDNILFMGRLVKPDAG